LSLRRLGLGCGLTGSELSGVSAMAEDDEEVAISMIILI